MWLTEWPSGHAAAHSTARVVVIWTARRCFSNTILLHSFLGVSVHSAQCALNHPTQLSVLLNHPTLRLVGLAELITALRVLTTALNSVDRCTQQRCALHSTVLTNALNSGAHALIQLLRRRNFLPCGQHLSMASSLTWRPQMSTV